MGKKNKKATKGAGIEKTVKKTEKKLQKKLLAKIGEEDIDSILAKHEKELASTPQTTETICPPPSPRVNFAFCAHPEKDELFVFGGEYFNGQRTEVYGDFFFYNIAKNEWRLVKTKGGPTPRSGAQIVSIAANGGELWLFGGEFASPSALQYVHFKDLWVFRLNAKQWEKVAAPNGPSARSASRMVVAKKRLVVFGGFHDNNQTYRYFNDLFIFSLETYTWLQVQVSGTPPAPRSGCCMAAGQDGKILVWGGYSKSPVKKSIDRGVTHADMFALAPDKSDATGLKWKWTLVKPGGVRPLPRSGMSVAVGPNSKAYVFGGVMDTQEDEDDLEGQFGNDLHMLDLTGQTWRRIELAGKKDKKSKESKMDTESASHSASSVVKSDGVFTVVVGGGAKEDAAASEKSVVQNPGFPAPRMNAGMVISKGILYLFGGIYEQGPRQFTLCDFYSLDLHKMDAWKTLIANSETQEWLGSDSEGSSSEDSAGDDSNEDDEDDGSEEESSSGMETD